jgi:YidC/Oxa1 family membrane protein insertase
MNPLEPFETAIGWVLAVFYQVIPNLGVSIILLTCAVMAILLPLTAKQTRSMIAMQRIQPEIKKLQAQYKDDRQKQNEELMKFYQENNINPLSGCLPLVIQMPVLFALFRVLRSIQDHIPTSGQFNKLFTDLCGSATSASACKNPVDMHFLGLNLMVSPANSGSVTSSFIGRLPYFIAVAAVVASAWYQMWQTQIRQKRLGNAAAQNNPINKQMQVISRVFPIFFGWFAYIASSGLVLYFVTSALWRIGQQHLVLNKYYDEQANVGKKKPKPKAAAVEEAAPVIDVDEPAPPKKQLPPNKPAPASGNGRAKNGSTNGSGNGEAARSQPSPHTSRKKKKRRR